MASLVAGCGALPVKHSRDSQSLPSIDRDATESTLIANYLDTCLKVAGAPRPNRPKSWPPSATTTMPPRRLAKCCVMPWCCPRPTTPGPTLSLRSDFCAKYSPALRLCSLRSALSRSCNCSRSNVNNRFKRTYGVCRRAPERTTNDRIAQLTKRLTTESEENTRLKRALADAQAKLDAIANIEGSANKRPTQQPPEGRKP